MTSPFSKCESTSVCHWDTGRGDRTHSWSQRTPRLLNALSPDVHMNLQKANNLQLNTYHRRNLHSNATCSYVPWRGSSSSYSTSASGSLSIGSPISAQGVRHCTSTLNTVCSSKLTILIVSAWSNILQLFCLQAVAPTYTPNVSPVTTLQPTTFFLILVTFPMFLMKSFYGFRKAYSHQQREQQQRHHLRTAELSLLWFDQSEKRICRQSRKLQHSQYYQGHTASVHVRMPRSQTHAQIWPEIELKCTNQIAKHKRTDCYRNILW